MRFIIIDYDLLRQDCKTLEQKRSCLDELWATAARRKIPNNSNHKADLVQLTHEVGQEWLAEVSKRYDMVAGNPGTWVAGVSAATHGTSASHAQRLEQEAPDPSCLKQIYHDIVTGGVEVVPDGSSAVPINARQQSEFAAAAVQEPLEEMPPPAPGHHDAETHP